jgi:4-hydroxysphinganine ceramide fatty acyl 2-hydroxylase
MTSPLVWQMCKLHKEEYLAWVHTPFLFDGSEQLKGMRDARLFESNFMELLSRTVWWVVPLCWVPASMFMWTWFYHSDSFSVPGALLAFATGVSIWTLIEYSIHRFIFHLDDHVPDHPVSLMLHFLLHGIHHKVPMDRGRLVLPPALFAILCTCVYIVLRPVLMPIFGFNVFHAIYGSGMFGYILYDMMHYSQHHASFTKGTYFHIMKQYHMKHHYSGLQNVGYGITTKFWDHAFNTVLDVSKASVQGQKPASLDVISKSDITTD